MSFMTALKSRWSVRKAKRHNAPFEQTVLGSEGGFPFVALSDTDEMIGMPKIYFGIDSGFSGRVE